MPFIPALLLAVAFSAQAQTIGSIRVLASDLAVQVSSATAASPGAIAVQRFLGPVDQATLLGHFLRAELLRGGAIVTAPDGTADFDLSGGLHSLEGEWHVTAELWRRSQKTLVGTWDRRSPHSAPAGVVPSLPVMEPPAVEHQQQVRQFWLKAGPALRGQKNAWASGIAFRPASRRWEFGFDVGRYQNRSEPTFTFNPGGNTTEWFEVEETYIQSRLGRLFRPDWKYLTSLQAGAGPRLVLLNINSVAIGPARASSRHHVSRLFPALYFGAAKELWGDLELSFTVDWVPESKTVGPLRDGGVGLVGHLGVRLPI